MNKRERKEEAKCKEDCAEPFVARGRVQGAVVNVAKPELGSHSGCFSFLSFFFL